MYSPPLYSILKFNFGDIEKLDFDITDNDGVWILEQDNQLFRQIRLITGDAGKQNRHIFFVSAKSSKTKKDRLLCALNEGILLNGKRYFAAERSASMVRQTIFSFVSEEIYTELSMRIGNGIELTETVISKYMAYRALLMSSCFCLENYIPKIIVCDDYHKTIKNQNIRYLATVEKTYQDKNTGETKTFKQEELREGIVDVDICPADGAGILHPIIAQEIRDRLRRGEDECQGTSFMLRAPFIKGVVHEVDYTRFFLDNNVEWITDIWGVQHSVYEPMIILTKSQYKCFNYYKEYGDQRDYQKYWDNFKKYNHCIGIAKWNYAPEDEPVYTRCNYQVLQTLNMSKDDFVALADYSRHWAEKIINGDAIYINAFLGLFADHQKPSNDYVRAILKNPDMAKETTVRKYLRNLLKKRINDMKCGKVYIRSTFRIIAPDIIALMESIGGLPIVGCLRCGECWSQSARGVNLGKKLLTRNPHISASENIVLEGVTNELIEKYLSHLFGVTMANGESIVLQRWNGADVDGDLVLEFDDPFVILGVDDKVLPVIDLEDKKPALSEPFNRDGINAYTLRTLDNRIGEYSNIATCYHNKDCSKNEHCERLEKFFTDAIDFISVLNGREIDSAKTGVKYNVPRYISKHAKPFPYFMKYASEYYGKHKNFNRTKNSNMNYLCYEIEHWERELIYPRKKKNDFDWHIMVDETIPFDDSIHVEIESLHKRFTDEMKEHAAFLHYNKEQTLKEYGYSFDTVKQFELDYGYYYKKYEEEAQSICRDVRELANYAVRSCYSHSGWNQKFMWIVASQGILNNLVQQPIKLPEKSDVGTEYLGRYYELKDVMFD
jgi:hypothetical protein